MILQNESLTTWIEDNLLSVTVINDSIIEIEGAGKFLLVKPKNLSLPDGEVKKDIIFNHDFAIELSDIENDYADQVDNLLFQFGNRWYYTDTLTPEEIKEFRYIGKPTLAFAGEYRAHLGIHGGFELCNGSRTYPDWIKKAKFLGITTLGICEQNTLAGTLSFQGECKDEKIKSIIGETIRIRTEKEGFMNVKMYVKNEEGWNSILKINKIINVDNAGEFIPAMDFFKAKWKGLICVLTPEVPLYEYLKYFQSSFEELYFQLDFVEWSGNEKDKTWLLQIKEYLDKYLKKVAPILITDSYYLDKHDHDIQKSLNIIGKVGFKNQSKDQYFKSIDEIYMQVAALFSEENEAWVDIMDSAISNLNKVCDSIDFKIPVGHFRLPEYEWDLKEWEQDQMADEGITTTEQRNEELFFSLIEEGIQNRNITEDYQFERLEEEISVIKEGGFISYFLILWDILEFCKKNDILYGIGRGSAAGSLVSYLLGIVGIDPLQYGLLFSRFLNKGRLGKSLPDIDLDFQGERRGEVLNYIKEKYGYDYVTVIGTYSTLKIKSALKDLCREKGVDYQKTNFVASLIDDKKHKTVTDLFKLGSEKPDVKTFLQKNYSIIEKLPLCIKQTKTASIHASGVVIVPKKFGTVYEQMPIRCEEDILISEWEGEYIDQAGFLKCDILGVKQLDKISAIYKLIKENGKEVIPFDQIPLDDHEVFNLFQDGYTEDVFQFGTPGLKAYCKELKPDNVEDLIAAVSLYRPGPMESGMHKKYIKVKNGLEAVSYQTGTEEITKNTYGQIVYQEQIMQIVSHMAGFDLVEADDIRKALGKKDQELLDSYKNKFIDGCAKHGYEKDNVSELWDKMEAFAKYSFNKSHGAAYAITGYFCQYYKYHYPIEFWTVSMQYADEPEIINRISEISKISDIEIAAVDINKSTRTFFADNKTNTIFWSITSVKWVGEKAVVDILSEREKNGEFFSIEDFCDRTGKYKSINKRTVINLILSGGFDKVEKIKPYERGQVLEKYYNFTNTKSSKELLLTSQWKDYQWILRQKELTGFGFIDYLKIIRASRTFAPLQKKFKENTAVLLSNSEDEEDVIVAGILVNVIERKSKKGVFAQLELVDNTDTLYVTLWNDSYEPQREALKGAKDKIILLSGKIVYDSYKQFNVIQSKSKTEIEII
jgi:DNA polymerase-3 subunit alpha